MWGRLCSLLRFVAALGRVENHVLLLFLLDSRGEVTKWAERLTVRLLRCRRRNCEGLADLCLVKKRREARYDQNRMAMVATKHQVCAKAGRSRAQRGLATLADAN